MKNFRWEGINLCEIFVETIVLVGRVEASWVGGWCSIRKGVHPGSWIPLFLILWIHNAMDFSDWTHIDMVQ